MHAEHTLGPDASSKRKRNFCDECGRKIKQQLGYRCTGGCDYDCCAECLGRCCSVSPAQPAGVIHAEHTLAGELDGEELIAESIPCLFGCGVTYSSSATAYSRMRAEHGLDWAELRASWGLDFYSSVKLLNFLRSLAAQLNGGRADFRGEKLHLLGDHGREVGVLGSGVAEAWRSEQWMTPVIEQDGLLTGLEVSAHCTAYSTILKPLPPPACLADGSDGTCPSRWVPLGVCSWALCVILYVGTYTCSSCLFVWYLHLYGPAPPMAVCWVGQGDEEWDDDGALSGVAAQQVGRHLPAALCGGPSCTLTLTSTIYLTLSLSISCQCARMNHVP